MHRAWALVLAALLLGCGGGSGDARDRVEDVAAGESGDGQATCLVGADCPYEACRLSACQQGICVYVPAPDGSPCDDGDPCSQGDRCLEGACVPEAPCQPTCVKDEDCPFVDPEDLCKGRARCVEGACDPSTAAPVLCDSAALHCYEMSCDPKTGGCVARDLPDGTVCDDGRVCTRDDQCVEGVCVGQEVGCECEVDPDCAWLQEPCGDRARCRVDVLPHLCEVEPDSAIHCEDDNPSDCLGVACDALTDACASHSLEDGSACVDDDPCTDTTCVAGACVPYGDGPCECQVDDDCYDDSDACNGVPFCDRDVVPFVCRVDPASLPAPCDTGGDGACRLTACDPSTGACVEGPGHEGDACEAAPCFDQGRCVAGACVGEPRSCDDGNACTDDVCIPDVDACRWTLVEDGTACEDGDACSLADSCHSGVCRPGLPRECDDLDPCTTDECLPGTGACQHVVTPDAPCEDGDLCTLDDKCSSNGVCDAGYPKDCDDHYWCTTTDACDPLTGACVHSTAPDVDQWCDDNDPCTINDYCLADGSCVGGGVPVCPDAGPCRMPVCDSQAGGCIGVPDPTQDGEYCPLDDPCAGPGACAGGVCGSDLVDSDCCVSDADCDDTDACSVESCVQGRCQRASLSCTAAVGCDARVCQEGACHEMRVGVRRVLFLGDASAPQPWVGLRPRFSGALVVQQGAYQAVPVPHATIWTAPWGVRLRPLEVPAGTATLRVRMRGVESPSQGGRITMRTTLGEDWQEWQACEVLDDDPGDGLLDCVLPFGADESRVWDLAVRWSDPRLALEVVEVAHLGGPGCAPHPDDTGLPLDLSGSARAVDACAGADGDALVTWASAGDPARIAWRVRHAGQWGDERSLALGLGVDWTFRLTCVGDESGWFVAYGGTGEWAEVMPLDREGVALAGGGHRLTDPSVETFHHLGLAAHPQGGAVALLATRPLGGSGGHVQAKRLDVQGLITGAPWQASGGASAGLPVVAAAPAGLVVAWAESAGEATPITTVARLLPLDLGAPSDALPLAVPNAAATIPVGLARLDDGDPGLPERFDLILVGVDAQERQVLWSQVLLWTEGMLEMEGESHPLTGSIPLVDSEIPHLAATGAKTQVLVQLGPAGDLGLRPPRLTLLRGGEISGASMPDLLLGTRRAGAPLASWPGLLSVPLVTEWGYAVLLDARRFCPYGAYRCQEDLLDDVCVDLGGSEMGYGSWGMACAGGEQEGCRPACP